MTRSPRLGEEETWDVDDVVRVTGQVTGPRTGVFCGRGERRLGGGAEGPRVTARGAVTQTQALRLCKEFSFPPDPPSFTNFVPQVRER